jgi:ABC-type proline/glycine betaine transport system substrate-binding protein
VFKKAKHLVISAACVFAACSLQPVFAQTSSSPGTITAIDTGWSSDSIGVTNTAPVINPAGCSGNVHYVATSSSAGYNTFYAAILTAYSTGAQVVFVVSNTVCTFSAPTIIGVNIVTASS